MRISSSVPRSLLLAGAFIGVLELRCGRADGQPSGRGARRRPPALPPGSPLIGRPDSDAAAKAGAGRGSAARGCAPTSCRSPSSSCRRDFPSSFMRPAADAGSLGSATKAPCSWVAAPSTRSPRW